MNKMFMPVIRTRLFANWARAAGWLALLLFSASLGAQTTSGNSTTGGTLWTSKGCSGCHTVTSGARGNAANAGGHIAYANTQGMGAAATTATERNDIAAYIAANNTTTLATQSVSFEGSKAVVAPEFTLNTSYGDYIGIRTANNLATRGTVSYSGTTITYNASADQCGTDTFTYEAYRSGATVQGTGTSNERSVTFDIADPAAPNISTSLGTKNGTNGVVMSNYTPTSTGGPPASYIASGLPTGLSVNSSTGVISGTPTQGGTFNVTLTARNCLNGNLTGQTSAKAITFTIARANQATLTALIGGSSAPVATTYIVPNGTGALSTSGGSGTGAVTYASNTATICTVSGSMVTYISAGLCTVQATKALDTNYNQATDTVSITINKANQAALTALIGGSAAPVATTYNVPNGTGALTTSGGSGTGAVTYGSNTPSVCSVASTTVTYIAAGTCTVLATKATDTNYNQATDTVSITVNPTVPGAPSIVSAIGGNAQAIVSFNAPTNNGGQTISSYTATCTSGASFQASAATSPITVTGLTNGLTYSCTVTATNATGTGAASSAMNAMPTSAPTFTSANNATRTITVGGTTSITATGQPTPTITMTVGTLPSGLTFNSGSGTATITGTPAAGTAGSYPLTFKADNGTFVTQSFTLTVNKANQTITFGSLGSTPMRPVAYSVSASASSGLAVSFFLGGIADGSCSVGSGGVITLIKPGLCTIVASQGGNTSYNAATNVPQNLTIVQGSQWLSFGAQPAQTYSPMLTIDIMPEAVSLDSIDMVTDTGLSGSITYASLTPSVCSTFKSTYTILGAGTCTIEASQAGDANYAAATPVTQDVFIGLASQTISWGAQSNQSFGTGGTFMISPLATGGASGNPIIYSSATTGVCTVSGTTLTKVSAGLCILRANQSGDSNYTAATQVTRSLTINPSLASAPVLTAATGSDSLVKIEFDLSTQSGGSPITGYTAACGPSGNTANGATSPIYVTGLTNDTMYSCAVFANNAAGASQSNILTATPVLRSGSAMWGTICSTCHGAQPAGVRFNAGGTTGAVINYVRSVQMNMMSTTEVQELTLGELAEIAKYIETFVPPISMNTAFNTPVDVDVSSHLTLGFIAFEFAEVVTAPLQGSLGAFTGTTITYTPTPGYVGSDTFTYRGNHSAPGVPGDAHTVTINIAPPPVPVITSPAIASGTFNTAFAYQITATNSPTSYGAAPLGGNFSIDTMTGAISGTPMTTGTFMVNVSATNAGGTSMQVVAVTISPANQSITFGVQGGQAFNPNGMFALNPVASATSGLAVSYSSLTPAVCSISGTTVTMLTAGNCGIAANQAGDANYNAALQVARVIVISATAPGAPTIGTATPGSTVAAIAFASPSNNGGASITSYRATCNPGGIFADGGASPINVTGLTNNTQYTCSVTATNAAGTSTASGTVLVTPTPANVPPAFSSAAATTFTVLSAGTFNVTATGTPSPAIALTSGALPTAVTFPGGTGSASLSGTPAAGTVGTYMVTFTANGSGAPAMQSFTLTVQKASQSISFTGPASQPFTPTPIVLSASATSGLAVTFTSNTLSVCTVNATNLTLLTVGTCSITANQTGNADYNAATGITQGFNVSQATQTITFPIQSPVNRNFLAGSTFPVNPTASASSGLAISYSSTTGSICSVVGTTVTMVAAGTCTIAANQSGSANYLAAAQQTRSVALNATAPGAPTIGAATPGNMQASIAFTAPSNNGGSPITGYTASCSPGPITAGGMTSPIVVTGLTNNVVYTCSVTATNAVNTGAASATVNVTPLSGQGITTWQNVCSFCHGSTPIGNQLNGAGTTATVVDYVRTHQPLMMFFSPVQNLSLSELADVAAYIATEIPPNDVTTSLNTPVQVNVGNHITLTAQSWSAFDSVEIVTPPANGSLGVFAGTTATYTPTNGYLGADSFTYRGKLNSIHVGDPHTVSIMVKPAAPSITSSTSATGMFGQAFSYQITASNTPTSFGVLNLPAGLAVDTNTGLISGTPTTGGSFNVSISATNAGGTGQATLMLQIDPAVQTINFPAQTTLTRSWVSGGTFPIAPTATGGASMNPITYGSNSTSVCTVSGTTVTIVTAGICVISADQAGNTNYAAAPQVTRSVTINAIAPSAPTIGAATAGNAQASIAFTASSSNGGSPITGYTASCGPGPVTGTGASSPIVVTGLANNTTYACSVTATNAAAQTSLPSTTVMVTPVALVFTGPVVSRKTHGGIDRNITIPASPLAVEPRGIGAGHQIVFTFNNPVTSVTSVTATDAVSMLAIGSASSSFSGNELTVILTGIPDNRRVTVTVTGANGIVGVNASATLGFLVGDVNGSYAVNAADIAAVKANQNQPTGANNFRMDFDATGTVTAADVSTVKARAGLVLP